MTAQTCVKIKVTDTEFKHANKSCNPVDLAVAQTLGVDEHLVQTQRQGVLIFNNYLARRGRLASGRTVFLSLVGADTNY